MRWLTNLFGRATDPGSDTSACAVCGKRLRHRINQQTVRRMFDSTRGIERRVSVTQLFCPKCNVIYDADVYGEVARVEHELAQL